MSSPPLSAKLTAGASAGLLILAAVAGIAPKTTAYEGERSRAYYDPAHVPTYCIGETQNVDWNRVYSSSECADLLRKRLAHDYAPAVLRCAPRLAAEPIRLFEAAIDASYNAGPGAFCHSPMAAAFRAGQWRQGCHAFSGWRVTAKGNVLPGLVTRRKGEELLCLSGLGA